MSSMFKNQFAFECETNLIEVQTKVENESFKVFEWFRNNYRKVNGT